MNGNSDIFGLIWVRVASRRSKYFHLPKSLTIGTLAFGNFSLLTRPCPGCFPLNFFFDIPNWLLTPYKFCCHVIFLHTRDKFDKISEIFPEMTEICYFTTNLFSLNCQYLSFSHIFYIAMLIFSSIAHHAISVLRIFFFYIFRLLTF